MRKVIINTSFVITAWCLIGSLIWDSYHPEKLPQKKVSEINNAMDIYKAGYYSGAIRQKQVNSVDSIWIEDSVSFRKHIFSIQTKRI